MPRSIRYRRAVLLNLSPLARADAVKELGLSLGFDDVGVASPEPGPEMDRFDQWLEAGYHGEMHYMERHRRRRVEPDKTQRGVRSVIVCAFDYDTSMPRSTELEFGPDQGWISRYAWGTDYHDVMEPMLDEWVAQLQAQAPGHAFRHYVDHGPVLEKVFAARAGLGWLGKHTNLIHRERGSFFFLAVILTDLEMAFDEATPDHCGSCTACLDACLTAAFPQPYVLDATLCLSYLNIELKGEIPPDQHANVGPHVYGCDICQDVCPWNRKAPRADKAPFRPREGLVQPRLSDLAALDDSSFGARFSGSPIHRRGRERLQHAARVVAAQKPGDGS